jgi:hypothetical protein
MTTLLQLTTRKIRSIFFTEDMMRDTFLFRSYVVLLALLIVLGALSGYFYYRFPEVIVYRSNIYFGIDLIGVKSYSGAIPLIAIIITSLHMAMARVLYLYNKELARVLIIGTGIVLIFFTVNIFFLINLNS